MNPLLQRSEGSIGPRRHVAKLPPIDPRPIAAALTSIKFQLVGNRENGNLEIAEILNHVLAPWRVTFSDEMGQESAHPQHARFSITHAVTDVQGNVVIGFANDFYQQFEDMSDQEWADFTNVIASLIVHEFTHRSQINAIREKHPNEYEAQNAMRSMEADPSSQFKYYSNPHEIAAFARTIVQELRAVNYDDDMILTLLRDTNKMRDNAADSDQLWIYWDLFGQDDPVFKELLGQIYKVVQSKTALHKQTPNRDETFVEETNGYVNQPERVKGTQSFIPLELMMPEEFGIESKKAASSGCWEHPDNPQSACKECQIIERRTRIEKTRKTQKAPKPGDLNYRPPKIGATRPKIQGQRWIYHPNFGVFATTAKSVEDTHVDLIEETMGHNMTFGRAYDSIDRGYALINPEAKEIQFYTAGDNSKFMDQSVLDFYKKKFPRFTLKEPEYSKAMHASKQVDAKMQMSYKKANVQACLPASAKSKIMTVAKQMIPDEDLGPDGREDDPHITVKFGVEEDLNKLNWAVGEQAPFTVTLGKCHVFTAQGGGGSPIVAEAHAPELHVLHELVDSAIGNRKDDFTYNPHVTIAFVKPELAQKYEGSDLCAGITFSVGSVVLSQSDGQRHGVPFGQKIAATSLPFEILEKGVSRDEALLLTVPLTDIDIDARVYNLDVVAGKGTWSKGPVDLYYNTRNKQLLVEDGMHRIVEAHRAGKKSIRARVAAGSDSMVLNVPLEERFDWSTENASDIVVDVERMVRPPKTAAEQTLHLYHGTTEKFDKLKAVQYLTTDKQTAIDWAKIRGHQRGKEDIWLYEFNVPENLVSFQGQDPDTDKTVYFYRSKEELTPTKIIKTATVSDIKDIDRELQRVAFGNVVALQLKNGLIRVMDNHYDVIKPKDVDPVVLYLWLVDLPDNLSLQKFGEEWKKFLTQKIASTRRPLLHYLQEATPEMAAEAQKIYDSWEQDENGEDPENGIGGICDEIANAITGVIYDKVPIECSVTEGGQPGDDHAYVIVYMDNEFGKEVYAVDIPHGVYETGGGYSWKKIPDVKFKASDVEIGALDIDPAELAKESSKTAALEPDLIDTDPRVEFNKMFDYMNSLGWRGRNPWYPEKYPFYAIRLYSDGWKWFRWDKSLAQGNNLADLKAFLSKYDLKALRSEPVGKTLEAQPVLKKLQGAKIAKEWGDKWLRWVDLPDGAVLGRPGEWHMDILERLGLPTAGPAFDKVPRGSAEVDHSNKTIMLRGYKDQFPSNAVWDAIHKRYPGFTIKEMALSVTAEKRPAFVKDPRSWNDVLVTANKKLEDVEEEFEKEAGLWQKALLPGALALGLMNPPAAQPSITPPHPHIEQKMPQVEDPLDPLVKAIARAEGAHPERHNPGNLVDFNTGVIKTFKSDAEGTAALKKQLREIADGSHPRIKPHHTLREAGLIYSNGDPNWAHNVASIMRVSQDIPIGKLIRGEYKAKAHHATFAKRSFKIEVPKASRDHFWDEPPAGNIEFWAFRHPVICLPGEKVVFTFDGFPVAETVVLKTEGPGKTECQQTGKYKDHHKVFWNPSQFRSL